MLASAFSLVTPDVAFADDRGGKRHWQGDRGGRDDRGRDHDRGRGRGNDHRRGNDHDRHRGGHHDRRHDSRHYYNGGGHRYYEHKRHDHHRHHYRPHRPHFWTPWNHWRGCHHPRPAYYVASAPAFHCEPCGAYFDHPDAFQAHVEYVHAVPVVEGPVVSVGVGWVFDF